MAFQRCVFGVLLCFVAGEGLSAQDPLRQFIPPGTRVVIGVRVRSLVDALAAQDAGREAHDALAKALAQSPLAGVDLLRDLDEVLLTSPGSGQNPPMLVVMTGRFSEAALPAGESRLSNALLIQDRRNPQQALAVIDNRTALAGDLKLVKAALDGGAGGRLSLELAARVAAPRGKYDLWGAGTPVPNTQTAGTQNPLGSLDRFDFGVAFTHGLEVVADLHVSSPQDLDKLSASLKMIEFAMAAQPRNDSAGKVDLRTENGNIHLALSVPEEALKQAIAAQRAGIASALAAQLGQRGAAAAPAPVSTGTAAAPTARGSSASPVNPTGEVRVLKNSRGETVMVTLPGKD